MVQGGSGLHIFNSCVYKYLRGLDLTSIRPSLCEIPDAEVRLLLDQVGVIIIREHCLLLTMINFFQQLANATNNQNLREIAVNNGDVLIKSSLTMPLAFVSLHDRDTIIQTVALHHVLLKSKAEMDQFLVGLAALVVLDAMRANSDLFKDYFIVDGRPSLGPGV